MSQQKRRTADRNSRTNGSPAAARSGACGQAATTRLTRNEFPEFPAALSFVFGLTADEAAAALERRARLLRESIAAFDLELHDELGPPRLFLLETEYIRAVTAAELEWVERVVDDIRRQAGVAFRRYRRDRQELHAA